MVNIPANTDCIICGDFNVNLYKPYSLESTEHFISNFVQLNFI